MTTPSHLPGGPPPIEGLKAFLSARPVVKEILFRTASFQDKPTQTQSSDGTFVVEHVTVMKQQSDGTFAKEPAAAGREEIEMLYYAAWQPDHFFERRILDECELSKPIVYDFGGGPRWIIGRAGRRAFQENQAMVINAEVGDIADPTAQAVLLTEPGLGSTSIR